MDQVKKTFSDSKRSVDNLVHNIKSGYSKYRNDGTVLRKVFGTCRELIEESYNATSQKFESIPSFGSITKPYGDTFKKFCLQNSAVVSFSQTHPALVICGISSVFALPMLYVLGFRRAVVSTAVVAATTSLVIREFEDFSRQELEARKRQVKCDGDDRC